MELSAGDILINRPGSTSDIFNNTVVYVFEHNATGTAGIVLNRGTGQYLNEVLKNHTGLHFPEQQGLVHAGGPVNPRGILMLHTPEFASSNTLMINSHISLSSDDFMIQKMCAGAPPNGYRLFAGHCGWGPGQLSAEIDRGVWLTSSNVPVTLLLDDDHKTIYKKALELASSEMFAQYI